MKKLSIFLFFITFSVIGFSQTYKVLEYKTSKDNYFSSMDATIVFTDDAIKLYNANDKLVMSIQLSSIDELSTGEIFCTGKELVGNEQMSVKINMSGDYLVWIFNCEGGYFVFKTSIIFIKP